MSESLFFAESTSPSFFLPGIQQRRNGLERQYNSSSKARRQMSASSGAYMCLCRGRLHQGLSPLPGFRETTPLIATQREHAGLSDRHVRLLLQEVFDRALERMQSENWADEDVSRLRAASLRWSRHASATFDAPYRDMKDLQVDLRHNSLSITQNVYYNSEDEKRAHSIKRLPMKERS